ncbi:hypothetical protein SteCoe_2613 [Stentor coeruleus]|uniref:RING-type domain-containing protein n=1 Tax=Stentor coeruleus TaxID=5963 RepID=A0A1R2CZ40_9CILI|nr:hypothetical protein SteCoe_2613 [Stentor coeruleus]
MRTIAFQSAFNAADENLGIILLSCIYYILKIPICVYIYITYPEPMEKPLHRVIYWFIIVDSMILYGFFIKFRGRQLNSTILIALNIGRMIYFIMSIYGNIIYYSCNNCEVDNPNVTTLTFVLLIFGYFYFFSPCVLLCFTILCIQVLILILIRTAPNQQRPATEAVINKLQSTAYRSNPSIPQEDCVICADRFKESDLVIYLKCGSRHVFHESCLKDWIKINSVCPLCRQAIE